MAHLNCQYCFGRRQDAGEHESGFYPEERPHTDEECWHRNKSSQTGFVVGGDHYDHYEHGHRRAFGDHDELWQSQRAVGGDHDEPWQSQRAFGSEHGHRRAFGGRDEHGHRQAVGGHDELWQSQRAFGVGGHNEPWQSQRAFGSHDEPWLSQRAVGGDHNEPWQSQRAFGGHYEHRHRQAVGDDHFEHRQRQRAIGGHDDLPFIGMILSKSGFSSVQPDDYKDNLGGQVCVDGKSYEDIVSFDISERKKVVTIIWKGVVQNEMLFVDYEEYSSRRR
jgi:hypothetical protein